MKRASALADVLARLRESPADEEAWQDLYRRLWPFVYGVVYRRLRGAPTAAEDAGQEVFLRLARALPFARVPGEAAFRAYVGKMADNVARTYRVRLLREEKFESGAEVLKSDEPSPEAEADARGVLDALSAELDETEREIVRLLLAGEDLAEIAQRTGLSYTAAGVRVHRLRHKLREYLSEKGIWNQEAGL